MPRSRAMRKRTFRPSFEDLPGRIAPSTFLPPAPPPPPAPAHHPPPPPASPEPDLDDDPLQNSQHHDPFHVTTGATSEGSPKGSGASSSWKPSRFRRASRHGPCLRRSRPRAY